MSREINLVPDVKGEMIRALKMRNFILFLCIVVSAASVGLTALLFIIASGQQAIVDSKKQTVSNLSAKVKSYSDLTDFLTIKDQLSNLQALSDNKMLLSRTFNVLSALMPTNGDSIKFSELEIALADKNPTFTFDAQANALREPFIDYNVLDSFKKSMDYMRYDYGRYVDKEDNEIPAYCIIENGTDGSILTDPEKGIYAYWTISADGCNPSAKTDSSDSSDSKTSSGSSSLALNSTSDSSLALNSTSDDDEDSVIQSSVSGYTTESYDGQNVVRIWRTPQFEEWHSAEYLSESGVIKGVAHFNSKCITYSATKDDSGTLKWQSENDSCLLVPGGIDGINISSPSSGKNSDEELVVRFSAKIKIAPEVFMFNNKHVLALGPEGRHNVTDSYTQIQAMFSAPAQKCDENDDTCKGGN